MKIEQSKVRVDMPKEKSVAGGLLKVEEKPRPVKHKTAAIVEEPDFSVADLPVIKPKKKAPAPAADESFLSSPRTGAAKMPAMPMRDDYASLRDAVTSVQRLRATAQQELELIKHMRSDAVRYQQETTTRARSEANQLILHARLATQRQIEDMIRQASEEIQKMLADIRVIRITAQEELSAQRKFTDAAKLNSLSFSFKEQMEKTVAKPRRQPVATK
jgi:hypothetical protein